MGLLGRKNDGLGLHRVLLLPGNGFIIELECTRMGKEA